MEICLVTGSASETRFSSAGSIDSVKRVKLPALKDFMNQWHFIVSPSDVTDMSLNVRVSMPLFIPFVK